MICARLALLAVAAATSAPWMNVDDSPATRAAALLNEMTLPEKLLMLHGVGGPYVGNVAGNARLNIPALNLNDGPQGFRGNDGQSTAFPSGLTVAATWDTDMMFAWGDAMGQEFWAKGANVQLGPGMNVARVPLNGRNFEYLSGEDPWLGYKLVQPVVKGIQGQHVIANSKHYCNNNQETNRGTASMNVDERTEFEIYLPPWKGAVEAGVGSLMCSYNKVNHVWACENPETLNVNLKSRLGFSGWVMSDWGATHSTSINEGLDQEMPGADFMGSALAAAVASGAVTVATVNQSVLRILTPMFTMGIFDIPNNGSINANVTSDAHNAVARSISGASHVLVQNKNNVLPLGPGVKTIALIGSQAVSPTVHGGGSGQVVPPYVISPEQGFRLALGFPAPTPVPPTPFKCDPSTFLDNTDYFQASNPSAPATDVNDCCAQCGNRTDCNVFSFQKYERVCWFKQTTDGQRTNNDVISGSCRTPTPPSPPSPPGPTKSCNANGYCLIVSGSDDMNDAAAAAHAADVAIVFLATTSSEGSDRKDLTLGQDQIAYAAAAANANTVVVVTTPGAILMPWSDEVASILVNFMPGQEFGNAVADVVFGTVNPSGRLPITMPNKENEMNFTQSQYPGLDNAENATYSEMLLVGYRWYLANNVVPKFPFGHGLSYTTFEYANLAIAGRDVTFTVTNTGTRAGKEIAQLYIAFPAAAGEPPAQLRNFTKVTLASGASETVTLSLSDMALSVWDVGTHSWSLVTGAFTVFVGASLADTRLTGQLTV